MDGALAEGVWAAMMPATFPMVLGADVEGVVESLGPAARRFAVGEELFGQLLIAPLGSAGTYAECVAVAEDAPLARVPEGMDPVVAAALPTAGGAALDLAETLAPLGGKTVLIVGAGGGIGSFLTQLAAIAGARVIANAREGAAERLRGYGAAEVVDHTVVSVGEAVRAEHSEGVDVLVDLASEAAGFADLTSLVRPGGIAATTTYVADIDALEAVGVSGLNFRLSMSTELLERLADQVVSGQIVPPPISPVTLDQVPAALDGARSGRAEGKTVIVL